MNDIQLMLSSQANFHLIFFLLIFILKRLKVIVQCFEVGCQKTKVACDESETSGSCT